MTIRKNGHMSNVEITLNPDGTGVLIVDGKDLSNLVHSFTMAGENGSAEIQLELVVREPASLKGAVSVELGPETRKVLENLGWTSPERLKKYFTKRRRGAIWKNNDSASTEEGNG